MMTMTKAMTKAKTALEYHHESSFAAVPSSTCSSAPPFSKIPE
ncbi:hypothetical protein A2U01_0065182, partial [Trifolium medium]|nr:hypothetical protein [Trifolium medium]